VLDHISVEEIEGASRAKTDKSSKITREEIEVVLGRKQTNIPPKSQDIEEVLSQKQTNPLQRDNFFFLN
jgi:hypothetical protein